MIEGMVTTFDSIPLIGASIEVKSTKEIVFSDTIGMFAVMYFKEDKLKVRARGFSKKKCENRRKNQIRSGEFDLRAWP